MAKKYYDRDYVLKNLSISEKRLNRAIHVMKKKTSIGTRLDICEECFK